jgi:hypothetical protein
MSESVNATQAYGEGMSTRRHPHGFGHNSSRSSLISANVPAEAKFDSYSSPATIISDRASLTEEVKNYFSPSTHLPASAASSNSNTIKSNSGHFTHPAIFNISSFSQEITLGRCATVNGILDLRPNLSKTFDALSHGFPKFSGDQKDWKSFSQCIVLGLTHLGLTHLINGPFRLIKFDDPSSAQDGIYDENNNLLILFVLEIVLILC